MSQYNSQLGSYSRFCAELNLPMWSADSCVLWLVDAYEVQGLRKNTIGNKYAAFKWGMPHVAGCKVYDRTPGDQLYLVKRLIDRMPEDAQPKVAIGRAFLARIINAADRQLTEREAAEFAAWVSLSYAAFLRCSEADSM